MLQPPSVPRLPDAPQGPQWGYQSGLLNVLRLFFNQLHTVLRVLLGPHGGQYIDCPNGVFLGTGTQTLAAVGTGYPIAFNQTHLASAVHVEDNTKIVVEVAGVYNFQYTGCVQSTNANTKRVLLWFAVNGTPAPYSTHAYTYAGAGTTGTVEWPFSLALQAGDSVELYWAADDVAVALTTEAPTAPHPGIPASVCAVSFVAPRPL